MDSWALKAIEREADARALARMTDPKLIRVAGLSVEEVLLLKAYYELRSGRPADTIKTDATALLPA